MRSTTHQANRRREQITAILRERSTAKADQLAAELGVTVRTVYRDVDRLQELGATIVGKPSRGYRWYGEATA